MTGQFYRGPWIAARARRAPRTPREVRKHINRRAFALAEEAYERWRAELEAAIAEGAVSINELDNWRPS